MSTIRLIWRTVRHLKSRQRVYQVWNRLRGRAILRLPKTTPKAHFLTVIAADKPVSWQHGVFTFLNQSVHFPQQIDWNCQNAEPSGKDKLWTYNLNYFDFLNQPNVSPDAGVNLIRDFMAQTNTLQDGLEPYPTSLRLVNWVEFLSRHQIQDDRINSHLFAQTDVVNSRLEYHLAGNHLLENGFALLIGALYFRHERWFQKAAKLIRFELTTQILADGCHDERSPMYHQILLDRLLTVLLALQQDTWHTDPVLIPFLTQKAIAMLGWLNAITFHNGDVPMVNDAAFGIAPTTGQILKKANLLKISAISNRFRQDEGSCGYRMFRQNRYELFADVGSIGPNHQPGHAHADTFSFVLHVDNQPIIVDSGTSTYQIGQRRAWERSTAAHNTVEIAQTNSSEVWAGFRVGRRARVMVLRDTETNLTARHNGYSRLGVVHQRSWSVEPTKLIIVDRLLQAENEMMSELMGVARFHFHPSTDVRVRDHVVTAGPIQIVFNSVTKLELSVISYAMAESFNRLRPGLCLEIAFINSLETTITLLDEDSLSDVLF